MWARSSRRLRSCVPRVRAARTISYPRLLGYALITWLTFHLFILLLFVLHSFRPFHFLRSKAKRAADVEPFMKEKKVLTKSDRDDVDMRKSDLERDASPTPAATVAHPSSPELAELLKAVPKLTATLKALNEQHQRLLLPTGPTGKQKKEQGLEQGLEGRPATKTTPARQRPPSPPIDTGRAQDSQLVWLQPQVDRMWREWSSPASVAQQQQQQQPATAAARGALYPPKTIDTGPNRESWVLQDNHDHGQGPVRNGTRTRGAVTPPPRKVPTQAHVYI